MRDILKQIADTNNWVFRYARRDFANKEADDITVVNVPYIFLDPVKTKSVINDQNVTNSLTYSGSFFIALSSDVDELSYDERYINYIAPLLSTNIDVIKDKLTCSGYSIAKWETMEVVNVFDYNLDGLIVDYEVNLEV